MGVNVCGVRLCLCGESRMTQGRISWQLPRFFRGDECVDGELASFVQAEEAGCVFGFDWFCLVFTSPPVGLRPHCRSCDQDHMCFSIALYHLKSYNDIYTDWSLYHKFVAKISAQTNKKKKEKKKETHWYALTGTQDTTIHACMHTPTCRHTHTHKHLQVIVLEFMGHLIYRHTLYVWIQDVLIQEGTDCDFNC